MIDEFPDSLPLRFIENRGMQGGKLRAFQPMQEGLSYAASVGRIMSLADCISLQ